MSAGRPGKRTARTGGESRSRRAAAIPDERRLAISRRLELGCAAALTLGIVALHAYRVGRAGPLWRDEVSTLYAATLPSLSEVWSALAYESFPLLTYIVVRLWAAGLWLGNTDPGLRVLGALVGIGLLSTLWFNTRSLGYRVPLLSLALFALSPNVIQWGDSLRAYGLGSLLILSVYGLLWSVVASPTPRRIVLAALASILSVQCLYQNAILLFAICLGGMVVCLRNRMWRRGLTVAAIGAMAALSLAPYLSVVRAGRDVFVTAQRAQTVSDVSSAVASALGSGQAHLFLAWLLGGAGALVAGAAVVARVRRDDAVADRVDRAIFSLTILVVGTLAFVIFLRATRLPTRAWYCIGLMGCIALSIDILVDSVATTARRRLGRLVVALAIAAATIPFTWTAVQLRQTNVDVIMSVLQRAASPEDLIVLSPWYCAVTFERYYRGQVPWTSAPPIKQFGLHRYDLLKEAMATTDPQRPVFDRIATTLGAGHRVWVVGTLPLLAPGQRPPELAPAPHEPSGWNSEYYVAAWGRQLAHFIGSHAAAPRRAILRIDQPVSVYEDLSLLVFTARRS